MTLCFVLYLPHSSCHCIVVAIVSPVANLQGDKNAAVDTYSRTIVIRGQLQLPGDQRLGGCDKAEITPDIHRAIASSHKTMQTNATWLQNLPIQ